jgi:predicted LPLAT superfamily acyltransferase
MAVKPAPSESRNPGPSWGYRSLRLIDRLLPEAVFRPLRSAGTWVAVLSMPRQRGHSRGYLRVVLRREPGLADIHRHFLAVCEALMLRLRVAGGTPHLCVLEDGSPDFGGWLASERPVLLGMFHIGNSDLTGFMLAAQEGRRVNIVRLRVGNSHDTEALADRLGGLLKFVWVNDPGELLFALKEAGASGEALALSCDRPDHSARSETFDFLGEPRVFAFTIYHLALIFERPVLLSFGVPDGPNRSVVHASPFFTPQRGEPRQAALARAREHFQAFLRRVEGYLREHPYEWLNFLPL